MLAPDRGPGPDRVHATETVRDAPPLGRVPAYPPRPAELCGLRGAGGGAQRAEWDVAAEYCAAADGA